MLLTDLIFIICVQIDTALLRLAPVLWYAVVDIGLMNDLGDQLRPVFNQWAVGCRDLGAVNGIGRAIFDEEGKESVDRAEQEDDDDGVYDQEYDETATHCIGCV